MHGHDIPPTSLTSDWLVRKLYANSWKQSCLSPDHRMTVSDHQMTGLEEINFKRSVKEVSESIEMIHYDMFCFCILLCCLTPACLLHKTQLRFGSLQPVLGCVCALARAQMMYCVCTDYLLPSFDTAQQTQEAVRCCCCLCCCLLLLWLLLFQ